jgi:hypothetical protein
MSHLFMGAINTETNLREIPRFANKANSYKCPECSRDVILKKGKIRSPHFAHNKSDSPCNFYKSPNESQIHKEAKIVMKSLLDNKSEMMFFRDCNQCKDTIESTISKTNYTADTTAVLEYRFKHNNSNKSADVAMIEGDKLINIFEICHTHKTDESNRPNNIDWYEINANDLITIINIQKEHDPIIIHCMRNMKCCKCIDKNKIAEHKRATRIDRSIFYNNFNEQNRLMEEAILKAEQKALKKRVSCN